MKNARLALALISVITFTPLNAASDIGSTERPNIVLIFMDNFGWGEPGFNGGGIIRGAGT